MSTAGIPLDYLPNRQPQLVNAYPPNVQQNRPPPSRQPELIGYIPVYRYNDCNYSHAVKSRFLASLMLFAISTIIWPLMLCTIPAVIFSAQSMKKFQDGDNEAAIKYRRIALGFYFAAIVGLGLLLASIVILMLNFN